MRAHRWGGGRIEPVVASVKLRCLKVDEDESWFLVTDRETCFSFLYELQLVTVRLM